MMLDDLQREMNRTMLISREKNKTERFGGITCLEPANWQRTNDGDSSEPQRGTVVVAKEYFDKQPLLG